MHWGACLVCVLGVSVAAVAQTSRPAERPRPSLFDFGRETPGGKPAPDSVPRTPSSATTQPVNPVAPGDGAAEPVEYVVDVVATIDGSDQVVLSADGIRWSHKHWGWPKGVQLNGHDWDPKRDPRLSSDEYPLLRSMDFSKAKVLFRSGRDTVAVEREDDRLTIYFADSPGGAAVYEIRLLIPSR